MFVSVLQFLCHVFVCTVLYGDFKKSIPHFPLTWGGVVGDNIDRCRIHPWHDRTYTCTYVRTTTTNLCGACSDLPQLIVPGYWDWLPVVSHSQITFSGGRKKVVWFTSNRISVQHSTSLTVGTDWWNLPLLRLVDNIFINSVCLTFAGWYCANAFFANSALNGVYKWFGRSCKGSRVWWDKVEIMWSYWSNFSRKDAFVSLPTGYGKSNIYTILPTLFNKIKAIWMSIL